MPVHLDPPRGPQQPQPPTAPAGVAQTLAELALQRQASLLGAAGSGTVPPPARATAPGAAPGMPPAMPPAATAPPLPAESDSLSLSPQARASLGGAPTALPAPVVQGRAAAGQAPALGQQAQGGGRIPAQTPAPLAGQSSLRPVAPVPAPWPRSGVPAPLRAVVASLVQQTTALAQPLRVLAVQPWGPALLAQVDGDAAQPGLAPLHTWLVRQGVVQTPQGERSFTLSLRMPQPWLQALAQRLPAPPGPVATQAAAPAGALVAPFAGKPQALQSGVWALVVQALDASTPRTSAVLVLEFAPQPSNAVYGRDVPALRQDAWALMAALQASGPRPAAQERVHEREAALCQTPGCPYAGRAECEQPFCLALRQVLPVAPPQA